jgi:hypothetical protein
MATTTGLQSSGHFALASLRLGMGSAELNSWSLSTVQFPCGTAGVTNFLICNLSFVPVHLSSDILLMPQIQRFMRDIVTPMLFSSQKFQISNVENLTLMCI